MADGCVWNNTLSIGLAIKDIEHIKKFKIFINSDHKITLTNTKCFGKSHKGCKIAFKNKKIIEDISHYGITPKKSFTAKVYFLENSRDFWRGIIDGDGGVGVKKLKNNFNYPYITLCGSKFLLDQFSCYIKTTYPEIMATVHYMKNSSIYQTHINGKNAIKVIEHLYKDTSVYLDRKYKKAMQIIHG